MTKHRRKISKDVYERALKNGGYIAEVDEEDVFTVSEIWGYGVYVPKVCEEAGEYYVDYKLGGSCD